MTWDIDHWRNSSCESNAMVRALVGVPTSFWSRHVAYALPSISRSTMQRPCCATTTAFRQRLSCYSCGSIMHGQPRRWFVLREHYSSCTIRAALASSCHQAVVTAMSSPAGTPNLFQQDVMEAPQQHPVQGADYFFNLVARPLVTLSSSVWAVAF